MTENAPVIEQVDTYLQHCEDRNLEAASAYLAKPAQLIFPGGVVHPDLESLVASASGKYRWVRKHRDEYAEGVDAQGRTVVTSRGRLYGENTHGVEFEDVRYVDVFVFEDGRIAEQHVYNDLEVSGVLDLEMVSEG